MEFAIATAVTATVNLGISLLSDKSDKRKSDDDVTAKSSYGFPIEQPYGRIRLNSRNLFWGVTPMEEVEQEADDGKGGRRTQIRYLATFAVLVGWKTLKAYNRIWFGKELVYNSSPNATAKTREQSEKFFNNHCEFYYGSADQLPSPTIEEYEGVGNLNAMRHVSYIVVRDYPMSSNNFPTVDVEVTRGDPPTVSQAILDADLESTDTLEFIIRDVSSKIDITPTQLEFDTYMQNQLVNGTVFKQDGSTPQSFIEELQKIYFFFPDDQGDKISWKSQTTPENEPIIQISEDDLRAKETGQETIDPYEQIIIDPREIPSELWLDYLNPEADYDFGNQVAWNEGAKHQKSESIRTAIVLHDEAASNIVWRLMGQLIEQRRRFENISLLPSIGQLIKVGSLVTIPVDAQDTVIHITQKTIGVNDLYEFSAVIYDNVSPHSTVNNNYYSQSDVYTIPLGEVVALDIPLIKDGDVDFGIYLGVKSDDKWNLGSIYVSSDFGSTYNKLTDFTGRVTAGTVTQLPDIVDPNFIDYGSEIIVQVENGQTLESLSDSAFYNLNNLGLFGSEFIGWRDEELIAPNTYKLKTLLRGQRGTEWAIHTHSLNEQFVLLRGKGKKLIRYQGQQSDLGKVLRFKAVHVGSSLDEVTHFTQLTITGEALKPYTPANVYLIKDTATGDITIKWTLRTRRYGAMVNNTGVSQVDSTTVFIEILDDLDNVVRTIESTTSDYLYTAAEQTSDLGTIQNELSFNIAQASTFIGVGRALAIRNLAPRILI